MAERKAPPTRVKQRALPAPDLDYLQALRREVEDAYREQDAMIDAARHDRELRQDTPLLSDEFALTSLDIRDPTGTSQVWRTAAALGLNFPKLSLTPTQESDAALDNATAREKFVEETFRLSGRRGVGQPTWQAVVDGVCGDGGACAKLVYDRDLWDERHSLRLDGPDGYGAYDKATEEAKKAAGPPFHWIACDIRTVYPVYQGRRIGEVLEVTQRPQSRVFRQYRLARTAGGEIVPEELGQPQPADGAGGVREPATGHVTFLEHWDATYCTYAVVGETRDGAATGQVVRQWRHGYKRLPYDFAFGLMMGHWTNRKVGWGVAHAMAALIRLRSFLWTLVGNLAARDTRPPLKKTLPETAAPLLGADGQEPLPEQWKAGVVYSLTGRPGMDISAIELPDVAPHLVLMLQQVDQAIERLETPRFQGDLGGLEGAGFAISQVVNETVIQQDPLAQSLELLLERQTALLEGIITHKLKETVWVYGEVRGQGKWIGVGPDELARPVRAEWKLDPTRPSTKLVEWRLWHERLKAGTAHLDQTWEAMGENPDEQRRGLARDRIRASAWYQSYLDKLVAQQAGRGDILAQGQAAMGMVQSGVVPGVDPRVFQGTQPAPPALPAGIQGPPGAMGNAQVPDMGNLAAGPNGVGAAPQNGAVVGAGPGAVVPQRAAAAGIGIQNLGG